MPSLRWVALAACLLPSVGAAQSLWPRRLAGKGEIGVEWVRPTFDNNDEQFGTSRGVWIFDARVKAGKRINVIAALPHLTAATGAEGDATMGNILLGVEFTDTTGQPEFTIGLRRGNTSSSSFDPIGIAFLGDYDRLEEAATTGWILNTVGHVRPWRGEDGGFAELRFGVTGMFNRDGGVSSTSMLLDYGIRIGRETNTFAFGTGLTGRWPLSGASGGTVRSAVHQVFADASYTKGIVQPLVGVRLPFDEDLGEVLEYALTFGLRVVFQ